MDLGVLNLDVFTNSPHGRIPSFVFQNHSRADTLDSERDIILKEQTKYLYIKTYLWWPCMRLTVPIHRW